MGRMGRLGGGDASTKLPRSVSVYHGNRRRIKGGQDGSKVVDDCFRLVSVSCAWR